MAKSLRSKWRRKCRAVKRVRYGAKELERLKKTLGIDDIKNEVDMTEISEVAIVTDAKSIIEKQATNEDTSKMDTKDKRVFNPKTMRDQNGTYPVWVHPRKIHRRSKAVKKIKTKAKGKLKKK